MGITWRTPGQRSRLYRCWYTPAQHFDRQPTLRLRNNRLAVTFWWEKSFVLGNTQEERLEARLAIYITAYQTHSEMRMNGLSTDTPFNFELGQVLKDRFLAESVMGGRACNNATGLVAESRSFCSSQDMIPVNPIRSEARHLRHISDILGWHIFIFIQV